MPKWIPPPRSRRRNQRQTKGAHSSTGLGAEKVASAQSLHAVASFPALLPSLNPVLLLLPPPHFFPTMYLRRHCTLSVATLLLASSVSFTSAQVKFEEQTLVEDATSASVTVSPRGVH